MNAQALTFEMRKYLNDEDVVVQRLTKEKADLEKEIERLHEWCDRLEDGYIEVREREQIARRQCGWSSFYVDYEYLKEKLVSMRPNPEELINL